MYVHTHKIICYTDGIWGRIPQSMGKRWLFPTWHRARTWNSSPECKSKGAGVGVTLLPVTAPCFPPLKENSKALALHKGHLPKPLLILAPRQDVLLSPFKPPVKGTRAPSLRENSEKCQVPWRLNAKMNSSHQWTLPRGLRLHFEGCKVLSTWSRRLACQAQARFHQGHCSHHGMTKI